MIDYPKMRISREEYPALAFIAIIVLSMVILNYAFRNRRDRDPLVVAIPRIAIGAAIVLFFGWALVHIIWHPLLSSRMLLLLVIFGIYVACIPVFGLVYFRLYRTRHANFSFTANIADEASKQTREEAERKLFKAQRALIILDEAVHSLEKEEFERLDEFSATQPSSDLRLPKGLREPRRFERAYVFWTADGSFAACLVHEELSLSFTRVLVGEQDKTFAAAGFPQETRRTKQVFVELFQEVRLRTEKKTERLSNKLSSLDSGDPDAWNYLDFLYFSTITQTTVGYGDILPNSRIVRMWVTAQILLGYFIIVAVVTGLTFFQPK
jgi:hypothetical protein